MRPLALPMVGRGFLDSYLQQGITTLRNVSRLEEASSDCGGASQLVSQPGFPGVLAHRLPCGIAFDCYSFTCIDRWQCDHISVTAPHFEGLLLAASRSLQ